MLDNVKQVGGKKKALFAPCMATAQKSTTRRKTAKTSITLSAVFSPCARVPTCTAARDSLWSSSGLRVRPCWSAETNSVRQPPGAARLRGQLKNSQHRRLHKGSHGRLYARLRGHVRDRLCGRLHHRLCGRFSQEWWNIHTFASISRHSGIRKGENSSMDVLRSVFHVLRQRYVCLVVRGAVVQLSRPRLRTSSSNVPGALVPSLLPSWALRLIHDRK